MNQGIISDVKENFVFISLFFHSLYFPQFVRTLVEDVEVSSSVLSGQIDGLVVVCRQHPVNITRELLQFLKPGHPFVVFSPYKEVCVERRKGFLCFVYHVTVDTT